MAIVADEVQILVTAEVDKAIRELDRLRDKPNETQNAFLKMAKYIGGVAVTGKIISSFVSISKQSSKLAADAEEVRAKFSTVFGNTADDVEAWAATYSDAVGRSETDTLNFLGVIGDTLKPLGFTKDAVDDVSKQVVELANDLSSFNNLPTEEVIQGIQSALVGNVETLRRYGVVANEAAIQQEAINSGISETGKNLTAQEKAQAILNITIKGTTDAQGDLLRTQDSSANVQRALNAQLKESQELYGSILNDALTPLKAALSDEIAEINKTVKAWILRNKVLAGEATLVEALVSKQNEREAAEERLAQAIANVEAAENQVLNTRGLSEIQIERINAAKAAAVEQNKLLQAEIQNEILALQRQEEAIQRSIAEENAKTDAAIAATQAEKERAEKREEAANQELEDRQAIIDIIEDQTEAEQTYYNQFQGYSAEQIDSIYNARNAMQEYKEAIDEASLSAQDLALVGLNSLASGFEDIGRAIAEGELSAKSFGKLLLGVVADTLRALGSQLSALAAVQLLFGNAPGAAIGFAESAAAFLAAGVVDGLAGAMPEGGTFVTDRPTPLLVGDNPGGQERVTVEPVSSNGANVSAGSSPQNITVMIDGRQFKAFMQENIDNGRIRRSGGGRI